MFSLSRNLPIGALGVVKEEETYDVGVFESAEAEVVKLPKEPQSLVEPPPGSPISPPGSSVCLEIEKKP